MAGARNPRHPKTQGWALRPWCPTPGLPLCFWVISIFSPSAHGSGSVYSTRWLPRLGGRLISISTALPAKIHVSQKPLLKSENQRVKPTLVTRLPPPKSLVINITLLISWFPPLRTCLHAPRWKICALGECLSPPPLAHSFRRDTHGAMVREEADTFLATQITVLHSFCSDSLWNPLYWHLVVPLSCDQLYCVLWPEAAILAKQKTWCPRGKLRDDTRWTRLPDSFLLCVPAHARL